MTSPPPSHRRSLGTGPQHHPGAPAALPSSNPDAAPRRTVRATEADVQPAALLYRPGQLADVAVLRARGVLGGTPDPPAETRPRLPRRAR
ncbi:hypothetical protein [Streptomyces sp. NPDC050504]|uniref:hypothetical protein n=1 Tax=Streptomyces sp. NPDC050504 TaxID=3365618 RepID=UPI0037B0CE7E